MAKVYEDSLISIDHVVVGPLQNNVFTLTCAQTGEGVLIDAADEDELLLDMCKRSGVRKVITTHGHFDHIGAVVALRDAGIDIGIHSEDASMLPSYDYTLEDEDILTIGELKLTLLHTPGHTRGSISIIVQDTPLLFTGDTLFPGGPGATHFPGGDFATIMHSIEDRLMTLDPDTIVLPGHGSSTTIGNERGSIDMWAARGW
jgi:glyoxylase-like metal-dependent hydrolase (beta-lactamase superfamily II)